MLDETQRRRTRGNPVLDQARLEVLVRYVARRVGTRDEFDATRLNRALWLADAEAFALTGRPITGATYIRGAEGPIASSIGSIFAGLDHEGVAAAPDVSSFDRSHIAIVDRWIERSEADQTVDGSYDYAWRIAEIGEEIPLAATLASRVRPPNDDEMRWGGSVATKLALP